MKCTNCNDGTLSLHRIDESFKAHTCNECGGHWILLDDYVAWKEHHLNFHTPVEVVEDIKESSAAMLCPVNGIIMRKFRMMAKYSYRLDYSASIGGIWLDKGKWGLLKQEGLAGFLDEILSIQWQNKIKLDLAKESFTMLYENKFGQESYSKVRDIREWLNNHPRKADLCAYLLADHPYSAGK